MKRNLQVQTRKTSFRSDGKTSCRNCSSYGEPKKAGTIMVLEDGFVYCLKCYRILSRFAH